jgi:hypothetical protein
VVEGFVVLKNCIYYGGNETKVALPFKEIEDSELSTAKAEDAKKHEIL